VLVAGGIGAQVGGEVLEVGKQAKPAAQSLAAAQVVVQAGVAEVASQRNGAQESTAVQVPSAGAPLAREQTLQVSAGVQAVSQHTPSTQKPLAQSPGIEHAVVQTGVPEPLSQAKGAQESSVVQVPSAGAPLAREQVWHEPAASHAVSQQMPSRHA
jgi:hypothetical protein